MNKKIRAIVTGATGMVGEGVLHECLLHSDVEHVLVINRKPCGILHPKLEEIIHNDFFNILPIENQIKNYNACFFCAGVSSFGKKEPEYYELTYTMTLHISEILSKNNPGMTFCYVSGLGTDSSEKGRIMWARVKGKTENDLMKLPFHQAYMFRPGIMQPTKGAKNAYKVFWHRLFAPLIPLLRFLFPKSVLTLREVGLAMINCVNNGPTKQVLEVKDIAILAQK